MLTDEEIVAELEEFGFSKDMLFVAAGFVVGFDVMEEVEEDMLDEELLLDVPEY